MIRRIVILVLLLAPATGGLPAFAAAAPVQPQAVTAGDATFPAAVNFPQGDPNAGRLVFRMRKCFVCHQVAGAEGQKLSVRTSISAPMLDSRLGQKEPGEVITAIIAPSHKVGEQIARESGGKLSPMGDFNSTMTVRELIDLVAYLRALDETKK
jgi:mono/diheme cytochrome c family protein